MAHVINTVINPIITRLPAAAMVAGSMGDAACLRGGHG